MRPYPWQLETWALFEQRLASGHTPHAMLFTGPEGVGKLQFALAFMHRLFCHDIQPSGACGKCKACHLLKTGNHPDQYHIASPEDKNNISVEQVRKLIHYASLKPHSAPKKIAIIEGAELMNHNAANSLLKTLEEPPESCLLILITHRPDQLLATLRSRCQLQPFMTPQKTTALTWLKPQLKHPEQSEQLLALASGAPLQAMSYANDNLLSQRETLFSSLQALMQGKKNPVEVASLWLKMDLTIILHCMASWVTDMIRLHVDAQPPMLANPDMLSQLLPMSQQCSLPKMLSIYDTIANIPTLRKSNINVQLILEDMLVKWTSLNKS